MAYTCIEKIKTKNKFLSKTTWLRALIFDYVGSPIGSLPSFFKLWPCDQNGPARGGGGGVGHIFIGLY